MCGCRKTVPRSCMLPGSLPLTAKWPIASRGSCDVYEGFLGDSKVCVKKLRIYSNDKEEKAKRVCFWCCCCFFPLAHLTKPGGILSGSNIVETLGTPKRRPSHRNHHHSIPTNFGLDGWRRIIGIHHCPSVCRPPQSRRFPIILRSKMCLPHARYRMWLTASATSTLTT